MKRKVFLLTTLCVVGILLWAVCFFFGFYYHYGVWTGIPIALGVGLFMGFFMWMAEKYKAETVDVVKARKKEILSLALYVVFSFGSGIFVYHLMTVEVNSKGTIILEAGKQIGNIENYFGDTSLSESYRHYVDERVGDKKRQMESWYGVDPNEVALAGNSLRDSLINGSGYSSLEIYTKKFVKQFKQNVINNWSVFDVHNCLKSLEFLQRSCKEVIEYSKKRNLVAVAYECKVQNDTVILTKYLQIGGHKGTSGSSLLFFIVVVVLQGMILVKYFMTQRNNGGKMSGGKVDMPSWRIMNDK